MNEDQLFYVAQKAIIEIKNKILVLFDELGADLPGGKIQPGETDVALSLKREIKEETGLTVEIKEPFWTGYVENSQETKHRNASFIICYKTIYISGEIQLSSEHTNYTLVTKKTAKKQA